MVFRRELLPILLAAAILLIGPAQARAAPQWLDAETQNTAFPFSEAPDVATDANGNSVAVWLDQNGVGAAYRPRGGPWGDDVVDLEQEFPIISSVAPRVVARPDGTFVAVWDANPGQGDPVLRSATRATSGIWTTEDVRDLSCCLPIDALEASADGTVTVVSREDGFSVSNTKPADDGAWGAAQDIGVGQIDDFAVGTDGSAIGVNRGTCGESDCVRATYRPPGGEWGEPEPVGITEGQSVTGLGATATPGGSYTVVWSQLTDDGEIAGIPGSVVSSDRTPGPGGTWSDAPDTIVDLPLDLPGCDFGCVDVAAGLDGTLVAVWAQSGESGPQIAAALRSAGADWGAAETAGVSGTTGGPYAAMTTTMVPVAVWSSEGDNLAVAHASHRDAAGAWHPVELGTSGDDFVNQGDLAADGDGNALTGFRHRGGVFTSGFDGGGPRFSGFSVPPTGMVGEPLTFSAAAEDNWSGVAGIAWLFGDGGTASGGAVTHIYGAGGELNATATAADGVGNASQRTGTTVVTAGPTPSPTPGADPCGTGDQDRDGVKDGCDDNNGAARPVPFKTVNATVVSGDVFVKLPAGAARASQAKPPKGFVRLEGAETIPVGSILDTAKGRVRLRTASDTRNHVQTADFFRGRFVVRQVRKPRGKAKRRSTKLITDIILNGSSFRRACRTTAASISQKRRRSRKRVRRLFGDGKGTFRTRGRNAAATVRGTRWSVQDRCDGTLVTVQRGRVSVRDLVKRKTVTVRTGRTYLARRR